MTRASPAIFATCVVTALQAQTQPARLAVAWPPAGASPLALAQLDTATRAAERLSSQRAAMAFGYGRLAPGVADLNAIVGEHWLNGRLLAAHAVAFDRPAYLMFYPIGADTVLVGLAYGIGQVAGMAVPDGFDGDADRWHIHFMCTDIPGLGSVLGEDADDCRTLGGAPGTTQIAMLHVWVNVPNPDGQFAPFNPALPYVAVGLMPPTTADLADTTRSRLLRMLALALGESFGATPRGGSMIAERHDPAFEADVTPHRSRTRRLIPLLKEAEQAGDTSRYRILADSAVAEWRSIRQAYLDHAGSDALRTIIARWYEVAVDPSRMHRHEAGH